MSRQVILELVDFKIKQTTSRNINHHLINLLNKGLAARFKEFSLNFLEVGILNGTKSDYGRDVALSDDYNKFITNNENNLMVYNRSTSAETFDSELLFQVSYSERFQCIKLVKEIGGEFIYASLSDNTIVKIRVSDLMMQRSTLVWKSKVFKNVWGLDILKGRVYVVQYLVAEFVVLDCENGQLLSETELPNLHRGYGVHFFSEKEMLTSNFKYLELFEKQDDGTWESIRKSSFTMISADSIFYEELSNLIYISDSCSKQVHIARRDDFSIVKTMELQSNYGIIVDKRSGLLYLCDTLANSVIVYQ